MARSSFFDFLSGYESDNKHGIKSSGGKRFFSRSYSGSVTGGGGTVLRRSVSIGNRLTGIFSFTQANAYGAGLLAYGITTFLAYFLIYYFEIPVENGFYSAVVGVLAVLFSIPLLVTGKPIAVALQSNRVADFIFFEFFCIKRPHYTEKIKPIPVFAVAITGTVLGLLGVFVPSWIVSVSILSSLILFVAFLSPECTFLLSLMALPYLNIIPYSDIFFAALVSLTVISFIRKVVCGKRVIFFEQYDLLIILLVSAFLISGIFVKGVDSFYRAGVLLVMSFGYILAGNLITNRRIADCAMNAVVISSVPASVYSVFLFAEGLFRGEITLEGLGISSTFGGTSECAVFFTVSAILCFALSKQAKGGLSFAYGAVGVLNVISLALTGEVMALLALLVGALGYFVFKMGRASLPLVFILALLPYLYFALPSALTELLSENISGAESTVEIIGLWRAALAVFAENVFFGSGMGAECFAEEMSELGIFGYTSAKNIFIEIGLEAGIFALLIFVLLLLVRIGHRIRYRIYLRQTDLGNLIAFIEAALLALVCFGATEYVWDAGSSFYLFLFVFGMGSSVLRLAKKEVDDRTLYYEDTRDADYSAIDIHLR